MAGKKEGENMPSAEDYSLRAKEFVNELKAKRKPHVRPEHDNLYPCIETIPCYSGEDQNHTLMLQYRFDHLRDRHPIANIPTIPLPNGNHFYHFTTTRDALINILSDPEGAITFRGKTYEDLFYSDYEYWHYVFQARAKRRTLSGREQTIHGPFSELVPGDTLVSHGIPGSIGRGSTDVSKLSLPDKHYERYVPQAPVDDGAQEDVSPTQYLFFLIDNFGVPLEGVSHLNLPYGVQWWPASKFPADDILLDNLVLPNSFEAQKTFTGVLLVPFNQHEISHAEKTQLLKEVQKIVKRIRSYLHINHSAKMRIIGEVQFAYSNNNLYKQRINIYDYPIYRCWSETTPIRHSLFPVQHLIDAIDFAFYEPARKKDIKKLLIRAVDSLDLARTLGTDPVVAQIIIWSAIETLISPNSKTELVTNMVFCLMGLHEDRTSRLEFWERVKDSYQLRSDIVHSFDIPDEEDLLEALEFTEHQCLSLMKFVTSVAIPNGWSRDELTKELKKRALS
ncbi:hypothetical protein [Geothermobacter hydrogeniphilus]|uniref:hypothetical protein n=1 Tax=Geothermobacter hydrogeniphilus TaxID=1969733 RepID=UPI00111C410A|nr:hypothetical protein [Geothermobacter hydrogeniphilus]